MKRYAATHGTYPDDLGWYVLFSDADAEIKRLQEENKATDYLLKVAEELILLKNKEIAEAHAAGMEAAAKIMEGYLNRNDAGRAAREGTNAVIYTAVDTIRKAATEGKP